eukprot:CAMPEP_0182438910 /NCGR_PEP_ID=MMETSP1167-20130531/86099_1 /TAXON_ID=2988 /ORGANISM="Mallomonas Sp, Strain CCMP3275" /LENGTH=775 /DNA_ID=CAMNT_0024632461 /DNA_START=161 /DNA_END=2488 /DNA_ORIENTATION=+
MAKALEFWKEFDLDGKRLALDKQCLEMREFKSTSVSGRKRLNDITKSFRSKPKEEQLMMMTEVLKAYQEEIDQLSRRSKFSESSFHALYKAIYEAPDPVPVIESLQLQIASASTHSLEIERLRGELSSYESEFRQLKNQDITIRRLEDQLEEFRENFEEKVAEAVTLRMEEMETRTELRVAEVREHERGVERRLSGALERVRAAEQSTERAQSQMYEVSCEAEKRLSALMSENSILAESTERAQSRCAEIEREMEQLRASVQLQGVGREERERERGEEDELHALEFMVTELRREVKKREENAREERQKLEATVRDVTKQLSVEREEVIRLKARERERPSPEQYEELRRQVIMLQKIAFNTQEEDDEEITGDPERTKSVLEGIERGGGGGGGIESLLTARVKCLEGDLSDMRRTVDTLRKQEAQNKETITSLRTSLSSSSALISKLENDLENGLNQPGLSLSLSRTKREEREREKEGDMGLTELLLTDSPAEKERRRGEKEKERERERGSAVMSERSVKSSAASTGPSPSLSSSSSSQMTTILQAQRDRYKDRLAEAEAKVTAMSRQLTALSEEKSSLESDNISLYGKIRYLQSYASSSSSSSFPSHITSSQSVRYPPSPRQNSRHPHSHSQTDLENQSLPLSHSYGEREKDREREKEGEVEGRYRGIYESRMNPFSQFTQTERQRKLSELSVLDRIVLNTTSACVSTHTGRSIVLIYLLCMHLLVFFTLYYTAHFHRSVSLSCPPSALPTCPPASALAQSAVDMLLSSAIKEAGT